jgi:putative protease
LQRPQPEAGLILIDTPQDSPVTPPQILAPAGSRDSFLAAVAAGADAIYCGLKQFSARMEAKNFQFGELAWLTDLAHQKGVKVFVAINTILKPGELTDVQHAIADLQATVLPDALIVQDMGVIPIAKRLGFTGEIYISTLANVTFPTGIAHIRSQLGIDRVVIPRELDIDEIRLMAQSCPPGLGLEVFIHGALCYAVSGRCYWSSFLGGKSGLRGRCVQPCRRRYTQSGKSGRFFSCADLSMDVLAKVLLDIPQIRGWKIEGRKKGPHYVYHTVKAYKLLRDYHRDPDSRKEALHLLEYALGRPGTHYRFLPQRPQSPIQETRQTGSGLLIGRIAGSPHNPVIVVDRGVYSNDMLRVGYEDDPFHMMKRINRDVPAKGRIPLSGLSKSCPPNGAAVFLTDRREKSMMDEIQQLAQMVVAGDSARPNRPNLPDLNFRDKSPRGFPIRDQWVCRTPESNKPGAHTGIWITADITPGMEKRLHQDAFIWLPPVIWPKSDATYGKIVRKMVDHGHRNFVLNAPWQIAFFQSSTRLNLWAGPFCNATNPAAIQVLQSMGFAGVIISPELFKNDILNMPAVSALPLGIVISGFWPLCISRILSDAVAPELPIQSPKRETAWVRRGDDALWVYPDWELNLMNHRSMLEKAGYRMFVHLVEELPETVSINKRPGKWNWDNDLM